MRLPLLTSPMFLPIVAAVLALHLPAQICPRVQAKTVPATVQFFGLQDCGGVKFDAPGVSFSSGNQGCPLLALYTPDHEVDEPTLNETRTIEVGTTTTKLIFFRCERDWLLFIPIGSACVFDRMVDGAPVSRLQTVNCST